MHAVANGSRPKSRQSTTSIASNSTQPLQPHPVELNTSLHHHMPSQVWSQHEEAIAQQMSQAQQFQPGKPFPMPPAMPPGHSTPSFGPAPSFGHLPNLHPQRSASLNSIDGRDTPTMDMSMEDQQQFKTESSADAKPRRGAATTQANDNELRRLLRENQGRNLQDIARQINKDDTGSKQEKDKQIFGMLWYSNNRP